MGKNSWVTRSAVAATALLAALGMVQQSAAAAAAGHHQQVTHRAAQVDPVRLKAWLYPSDGPLASSLWDCFATTGAKSPPFICGQLRPQAASFTPSGVIDPPAPADPVSLRAWLYPSDKPFSPAAWECLYTTDTSNPQFICAQLGSSAPSFTPSR
jgi:hypothetical protein